MTTNPFLKSSHDTPRIISLAPIFSSLSNVFSSESTAIFSSANPLTFSDFFPPPLTTYPTSSGLPPHDPLSLQKFHHVTSPSSYGSSTTLSSAVISQHYNNGL